jgi:FtsH-binding integral membrane protein
MRNGVSSQSAGLVSGLKNFILYVYSLSGFGIGLIFFLTNLIGTFLLSFGAEKFVSISFFTMLIGIICEWVLDSFLMDFEYTLTKKVRSLLLMFGLKIIVSAVLLAPLFAFAKMFDPFAIILAFGITFVTFVIFALYVFISNQDLAFRKNEESAKTFGRIMLFALITLISLVLIQFIAGFFAPNFADKINTLVLIVSLILALIFVVYNNAIIRDIYEEYSHDGISLSRLGICGAARILDTFILLFRIILQILLKVRKKDD